MNQNRNNNSQIKNNFKVQVLVVVILKKGPFKMNNISKKTYNFKVN